MLKNRRIAAYITAVTIAGALIPLIMVDRYQRFGWWAIGIEPLLPVLAAIIIKDVENRYGASERL